LIAQAARAFDLAQLPDTRHVEAGGPLNKLDLVRLELEQIDPGDLSRQARFAAVGRPFSASGAASESA